MPSYNDQQLRLDKAFHAMTTLGVLTCDCGVTHFVSARGHGDYSEGELEALQAKAAEEPEKYHEEYEFDHVDAVMIDGRYIVPDCKCGKYKRYCDWIEDHADGLAVYLVQFFADKAERAKRELEKSEKLVAELSAATIETT